MKQRKRRRISVVGIVQRRDTGRPELAYGRRCPSDQLEHEIRVTDFALLFPKCRIVRDANVGRTVADGLMMLDGRRLFIEIDNSGKMNVRQLEAKWRRYSEAGGKFNVLVVAVTEGRMQRIRRGAELMKNVAFFTTFDRLRSGMAEPWLDFEGSSTDL